MINKESIESNYLKIAGKIGLVLLLSIVMLSANAMALDLSQFDYVADTTCDVNGEYSFADLYDGNYTVVATDISSDGTKWYAGHLNASLNGVDLVNQNIKINSTNEATLDHNEILGFLNRSSISGMTYVKNTAYPKQSTVVMVEQGSNMFVANTFCDADGNYSFNDVADGDYTIFAVYNASTVDTTKWYRGMLNVTVSGTGLTDQNIKINSSNNIDHTVVLGMLNRSSISGMTYVKNTAYPKQSTVVMVEQGSNELVANTVCGADGNYSFNDIADGDYSIFAVYNASTVDTTKWYRGMMNVTVTGADLSGLNIKINSSNDIDHTAVLGMLNKSSISGMTYVMKTIYPKQSTVVLLQPKSGNVILDSPFTDPTTPPSNNTEPQTPSANSTVDSNVTLDSVYEFFLSTTCNNLGEFNFVDVPNGEYRVAAVNWSTAMSGMWLTNVTDVTVEYGLPADVGPRLMKKNESVDHNAILSMMNETYISGRTYGKKGDNKISDVVLTNQFGEFVANTTCNENGEFLFNGIRNGEYTVSAVNWSTAMSGMWLTNVTDVTVEYGLPADVGPRLMKKNESLDHNAILSMMNETYISGKTYGKKGDNKISDVYLTNQFGEFVANTTCNENGEFLFNGIRNGEYTVSAINWSTAMSGMWLTNVTDVTVEYGLPADVGSRLMKKNESVDHNAIFALLDRTTISGMTYGKKGDDKLSDVVLMKKRLVPGGPVSNEPHLNISIVTGYASHEVQLAAFAERINGNPDLNMDASYYLAEKLPDGVDLSQMDIIYVNMFTTTAYKLQDTVQDAIDNGALVVGYNTYLPESEYVIPTRFNNDSSEFKAHLQEYWLNGASNSENFDNLMFYLATEYYGREDLTVEEPIGPPGSAIYHPAMTDTEVKFFTDNVSEYFQWYSGRTDGYAFNENAPTVGITFYKSYYPLDMEPMDLLIQEFEDRGINAIACYGTASDPVDMYLNHSENTKVDAVICFNYRGIYFDISELDVPVINGVLNGYMNTSQWLESSNPIPVNRMLRLYGPETYGLVDPIMIGAEEIDVINGGEKYVPHEDQVDWIVERTIAQAKLGIEEESDKKVAIIYYNHGGGKDNIGASYLEVAPSIVNLLEGMDDAGYDVDGTLIPNKTELVDLMIYQGRNVGTWAPGELNKLVETGKVELIPESTYLGWFNELPEVRRTEVIDMWGEAPGEIMVYTDNNDDRFIVIPKISLSDNVILAPQPTRGWLQDNEVLYHDEELPPHHQYIAFYLWMQHEFDADAMVNMGRHGTVEWLPGKDFCLLSEEWPSIMVGDIPVIYPYVMDGMGEGMQAKRRGNAVIIDHLIPPVVSAGSYGNYSVLNDKINTYKTSVTESESLLQAHLQDIITLTLELGLDSRVNMTLAENNATVDIFLDDLDDVLRDLRSQSMPYGLHILGEAPEGDELVGMVNSMLGDDYEEAVMAVYNKSESAPLDILSLVLLDGMNTTDAQMQVLLGNSSTDIDSHLANAIDYAVLLAESDYEIDQVLKAMDGGFIEPNLGGDPILRPDTLPSGRNFYAFDEQLIPTKHAWDEGTALVDQWIADYYDEHGEYPNKAGYILWAGESTRHEGVMESQIFYLLGVKPEWDEDDSEVVDVKLINSSELGRPRIDVMVQISGLYRDTFPMKVELIDKAVRLAYEDQTGTNYVRENTDALQSSLNDTIGNYNLSLDIAQFRVFGPEDGSYGTGMSNAVSASNTWDDNSELAELYINKMSYIYGQNIWGQTVEEYIKEQTGEDVQIDDTFVFENILDGTDVLVHSRSSNTYGATNTDEFFQYMSGLANAIEHISGEMPDLLVANLENPDDLVVEDVETYLMNELYTVFSDTNIEGWMAHGYEGARMMLNFVENLWGLEALTPGLVTDDMWDMTYGRFVNDAEVSDWMKDVNPHAYESVTGRMIDVARMGSWNPSNDVLEHLVNEYLDTVIENGVTCCHHTCGNPLLDEFIQSAIDSGRIQVSQAKMDEYKKIMEETRDPELEIATPTPTPTTSTSKSSSSTGTELNIVETSGGNQTTSMDSGAGEVLEEEASMKSPVDDSYVEGYEMTKETVEDESESSSYSISGSDIMASVFVVGLLGAIYVGFWRRRQF